MWQDLCSPKMSSWLCLHACALCMYDSCVAHIFLEEVEEAWLARL